MKVTDDLCTHVITIPQSHFNLLWRLRREAREYLTAQEEADKYKKVWGFLGMEIQVARDNAEDNLRTTIKALDEED